MPAAFAHDLYGRRVYERLRPEIRRFIKKNKDCFYLGVHGPDILFYYYPLGENSIVKEGYRIHEASAREFFMEGIEKLRNTDSPVEKSAKKAYLLGFACHFALDRASTAISTKRTGRQALPMRGSRRSLTGGS